MNNIVRYREQVDAIDTQIARLLEERFGIVRNIGEYKRENNLSIQDLKRDEIVLNNVVTSLKSDTYAEEVKKVFKNIILVSKGMQY